MLMRLFISIVIFAMMLWETALAQQASTDTPPLVENWKTELSAGFSTKFHVLGYVTQTEPEDESHFNPKNQLIQFPKTQLDINLRPDFNLRFHTLSLLVKPRLMVNTQWSTPSDKEEAEPNEDVFINEWRVQWEFSPSLIGSYGREVLLWGPSYLFSPSNPFFLENGQSNPMKELAGTEILRFVSIPNFSWTFSFISNLGLGREERETNFKPIHALKIDYTGQTYALSFNLSKSEGSRFRFGDYGQITVAEAGLLYTEGVFGPGTDALYPWQTGSPVGWEMAATKKETNQYFFAELIGGSYTVKNGPTLSLEYAYNHEGYSDIEAEQYNQLGREVSEIFLAKDARSGLAASVLGSGSSPGLRLLRRNYIFFQVFQTNIYDAIDLTLRYTHNLDDESWMFVPVVEWNLNDWIQIFALGTIQVGSPTTEFGRFIKYQAITGTKLFIW